MDSILSNHSATITLQRSAGRAPSRMGGKLASLSSGIRISASADEIAEEVIHEQVRARVRMPARGGRLEAATI